MKQTPTKLIKPSDLTKARKFDGDEKQRLIQEEAESALLIEQAKKELQEMVETDHQFPIEALPERLRNIVKTFALCSGFPIEFYISSLLAVVSTCIGNKYLVRAKRGFKQAGILYIATVAKSGIGKSPPMQTMFAPLFKIEKDFRANYTVDKAKWAQDKSNAEASKQYFDEPMPKQKELVIGDATVEDVQQTLATNPTGCCVFMDELTGWVGSFDKYRAGSDVSFWLEGWNNPEMLKVGRVGKDRLYIYRPFTTVHGGLQPGVLNQMADGAKTVNGFLARFLFMFPDKIAARKWTETEPDQSVYDTYNAIINFLHRSPSRIKEDPDNQIWDINSIEIPLGRQAKDLYVKFYDPIGQAVVEEEDEKVSSQLSKFQAYCLRFALILHWMEIACQYDTWRAPTEGGNQRTMIADDIDKMEIGGETMLNAIKITQYFQATAMKVLSRFDSPVNTLPAKVRAWYTKALPITEFKAQYAVNAGKELDISRSTVFTYLNRADLFRQAGGERSGLYQKKFL